MANSHMKVLRRGRGETAKMIRYLLDPDPRGKANGRQRVLYVYSTFLGGEDIEKIVHEVKLHMGAKAESIHFRVSFARGEKFRDEREFQLFVSDLMSAYLPDRPYLAVCHGDTDNTHIHVVATYKDSNGKSLNFKGKAAWKEAIRRQEAVDAVSQKYGFSVESRKPGTFRQAQKRRTLQEVRAHEKGKYIWKADLQNRIDRALQEATSADEFLQILKLQDIDARFRGKGISYYFVDAEGKQRKIRGRRLGTKYNISPQHQFQPKTVSQKKKQGFGFDFDMYDMMNIMDTTEEISEGMYDDRSLNF